MKGKTNIPDELKKRAEEFLKTLSSPYSADDIITAYVNGAIEQEKVMIDEGMHCKVFWHDGPLLDYTQEQQDDTLERIDAHVDDAVSVIIRKL